jgi:hypothetical protein
MRPFRGRLAWRCGCPFNLRLLVASCCVFALTTVSASAQDLFELEVFSYETAPRGDYEVELHTNVMSRGGVTPDTIAGDHRPAHVSVEVARGWTTRFETAIFVQTAPFGSSGSDRFAGGHVRSKVRIGTLPAFPMRMALSAEYTFNRAAFDHELQTLEVRPILDYSRGRLSLVANPSLELVTHGGDEGLEPVFDVSASAGWQLVKLLAVKTEYFSAAATTRHLQRERGAHHLMFGGLDLEMGTGWELSLSAGHCVTRHEPWLVRSVIGFAF